MVKTMPQPIDLLITGVDVVTFDDPGTVVLGGAIAIKGNTIAWIGPVSETSQFIAADTIPACAAAWRNSTRSSSIAMTGRSPDWKTPCAN